MRSEDSCRQRSLSSGYLLRSPSSRYLTCLRLLLYSLLYNAPSSNCRMSSCASQRANQTSTNIAWSSAILIKHSMRWRADLQAWRYILTSCRFRSGVNDASGSSFTVFASCAIAFEKWVFSSHFNDRCLDMDYAPPQEGN